MKNGRMKDVLVEYVFNVDRTTGMKILSKSEIIVWADSNSDEIIRNIEGVASVIVTGTKGKYSVYIDPRYDFDFVKAEIEASILCQ